MKQIKKGLVSIITPVFNGESFLSAYFNSLYHQTYKNMELILIDDGSTDQTFSIAKKHQKRLESRNIHCQILRTGHVNAAHALGQGLAIAQGEFLVWPDSDDILDPRSIQIRVDFLNAHPEYQCVRSLPYYFDFETRQPARFDEQIGDLQKQDLFWEILEGRTFVCCGCYMLRAQAFFEIYPDGKIPVYDVGQNFQMLLPFMYFYRCPTIDQALYGVAVRKNSHSRTKLTKAQTIKKYQDYEHLIDEIAQICHIQDPNSLKRIEAWKILRRNHLSILYHEHKEWCLSFFRLLRVKQLPFLTLLKKTLWPCIKETLVGKLLRKIKTIYRESKKTKQSQLLFPFVILRNMEWEWFKYRRKKKLKIQPTILSSNCVGTIMYHDLGIPWTSPTINLMIPMNEFIRFVTHLDEYLNQEITEDTTSEFSYPVGVCKDIKIHFMHYRSFQEAIQAWNLRKQRIDKDHLFIIGSEKDGCTYETIRQFDQLPYQNKVIFTKQDYPEFSSAFYIPGFEDQEELGNILNFQNRVLKRRYLDRFDYLSFLNGVRL